MFQKFKFLTAKNFTPFLKLGDYKKFWKFHPPIFFKIANKKTKKNG